MKSLRLCSLVPWREIKSVVDAENLRRKNLLFELVYREAGTNSSVSQLIISPLTLASFSRHC